MSLLPVYLILTTGVCLLLWSSEILNIGSLPRPQNLTLLTLNTQYVLTWDWDQTTTGNAVNFTAEYMAKYKMKTKKKNWSSVCERTTHTRCDLTGSDLHYLGMYMLRVRASANGVHSHWVYKDFCPDTDAKYTALPSKKAVTAHSMELRQMAFIYLGFSVTLCSYC
uniref:Fibronectin type-III domain-containing protein n=1 Tax=Hucho hucho TaxID=62062 RepID=A0A4W5LTQ4_9TELE